MLVSAVSLTSDSCLQIAGDSPSDPAEVHADPGNRLLTSKVNVGSNYMDIFLLMEGVPWGTSDFCYCVVDANLHVSTVSALPATAIAHAIASFRPPGALPFSSLSHQDRPRTNLFLHELFLP